MIPRPLLTLAAARPKPGQKVPSPCVNVCRMSVQTGWCEGCWRTLEEIQAWRHSSEAAQRAIWARVERRQAGGIDSLPV